MRKPSPPGALRALLLALALALVLPGSGASAYTLQEFTFDNPAQEQEFRDLIGKLRCLVCQNESLAGSQADMAQDLRKRVYGMMREGKSDAEIRTFLMERYGDFVFYEPPVKPSTYILWFGPFVLVAVGGLFLVRALRRKRAEPEEELSDAERARIDRLLAADGLARDDTANAAQDAPK